MDQSKSSEAVIHGARRRLFTVELVVGLFAMAGVAAAGWLAIGLGGMELMSSDRYEVFAEFDNISGLEPGASVEIAGVQVGEVEDIRLKDPMALVSLRLDRGIQIGDQDIASIRTKGIIGDRYVKISRGGSDTAVGPGQTITETESVVDIEDLIGKIAHNFSNDEEDEQKNGAEASSAQPSSDTELPSLTGETDK